MVAVGRVIAQMLPEARADDVAKLDRLRRLGHVVEPAAGCPLVGIAAVIGGIEVLGIAVLPVQYAEALQRLQQHLLVFLADQLVERALVDGLGQHLGDASDIVRPDGMIALLLAAEGFGRMKPGVLVLLHEDLQLHAGALAVVQERAVVMRDAPGADIDVLAVREFAGLTVSAHLAELVTALQRPAASARAALVFEDLHLVSRAPHLERGDHARKASAEDQNLRTLRRTVVFRRTLVRAGKCVTHRGHRPQHGRGTACDADQPQQVAPGHVDGFDLHRRGLLSDRFAINLRLPVAVPERSRAGTRR